MAIKSISFQPNFLGADSADDVALRADSELVVRALAGTEDGFEELVRRYQRPMVAYIYRMTGNYEAALDLTQDVFIKVYNALASYCDEYKFSTWIYRIAHNVAVDYLRRSSSREQTLTTNEKDGDGFAQRLISRAPSPQIESERAERRTEIEAVVCRLPEAYRELIVLRHAHDLNYDEIAEITGLPLGTIKNRIFRAREIMRLEFLKRGIDGM